MSEPCCTRALTKVPLLIALAMLIAVGSSAQGPAAMKFRKARVRVGGQAIEAEVAQSREEQEHGLMYRTELKDGSGMLFSYDGERALTFWMKNTRIPLDIGFFDGKSQLVDIKTMLPDPPGTSDEKRKVYESAKAAQYALELPEGWFARHHVSVGAKLELGKTIPRP